MAAIAITVFIVAFLFRYIRLLVGIYANITYRPCPVKQTPRFGAKDVTVIIPTTFKNPLSLIACINSISDCDPAMTIVVTADAHVWHIKALCKLERIGKIEALGVEHLNKRHQLLRGLEVVDTEIVVFADDNVMWPFQYLVQLLAIFEDPRVGAGGTRQCVRRKSCPSIWNILAVSYLERRVWNNNTTQAIDGSISTLSGRTAAYRANILKTDEFVEYFTTDSWLGRQLNTDDDKCLTRYIYSHGWSITIQSSTAIETSMEDGWRYIEQCKRWARAHWRGNFTVMTNERYWYSPRYFWGFYVIYMGQFQTPALVVDGILVYLLRSALWTYHKDIQRIGMTWFAFWVFFTKIVKMLPYFWQHPSDIQFVPASIVFGYLHGLINLYSLFTLHVTVWGSQSLGRLEKPREVLDGGIVALPEGGTGAE